jgi:hypothetical protein
VLSGEATNTKHKSIIFFQFEGLGTGKISLSVFKYKRYTCYISNNVNRIGGVMTRRGRLECGRSWVRARSGHTKDYKIGICYNVK